MENQQKAENMHANSESWVNEDSQLSLHSTWTWKCSGPYLKSKKFHQITFYELNIILKQLPFRKGKHIYQLQRRKITGAFN